MRRATIHQGDARAVLATLPAESVQCCVTSPPYWGLRDYGVAGQLGLEPTPEAWVAGMVEVFREVKRVLRRDGTLWLNVGDCFYGAKNFGAGAGEDDTDGVFARRQGRLGTVSGAKVEKHATLKTKDLVGQPWRLAFALQADGWYLRSDIVWSKPNPMPESVTDRPTRAHEYVFLLTREARYFYDAEAVREPSNAPWNSAKGFVSTGRNADVEAANRSGGTRGIGTHHDDEEKSGRNKRTVWTIPPAPFSEAHFATFPPALVEPCILAGTSERGACPACGAPWRREILRPERPEARVEVLANERDGGLTAEHGLERTGMSHFKYNEWLAANPPKTTGWSPSCACPPAAPVPCVVLDPFSGAGTTAMVALRAGRDAIGCELNPAYVEMSRRRILEDAPLLNRVDVRAAA